jgi:hypothetical protein
LQLIRRLLVFASALAMFVVAPSPGHGAEGGFVIKGQVTLPAVGKRKATPSRGQAFVRRAKNPLRPPDGLDPRREIVVVLTGGTADEADLRPRRTKYVIVGENFESDILPVVKGSQVELRNMSNRSIRLYSKSAAGIVDEAPVKNKAARVTKEITELHKPIDIREHDSVHFLAHIVAFENRYYSTVAHDGSFEIKGVPAGTWQVKVWYKDAWVTNIPTTTVTIAGKRPPKPIKVSLPAKLNTKAAK